jgi:hypothetical protein
VAAGRRRCSGDDGVMAQCGVLPLAMTFSLGMFGVLAVCSGYSLFWYCNLAPPPHSLPPFSHLRAGPAGSASAGCGLAPAPCTGSSCMPITQVACAWPAPRGCRLARAGPAAPLLPAGGSLAVGPAGGASPLPAPDCCRVLVCTASADPYAPEQLLAVPVGSRVRDRVRVAQCPSPA